MRKHLGAAERRHRKARRRIPDDELAERDLRQVRPDSVRLGGARHGSAKCRKEWRVAPHDHAPVCEVDNERNTTT